MLFCPLAKLTSTNTGRRTANTKEKAEHCQCCLKWAGHLDFFVVSYFEVARPVRTPRSWLLMYPYTCSPQLYNRVKKKIYLAVSLCWAMRMMLCFSLGAMLTVHAGAGQIRVQGAPDLSCCWGLWWAPPLKAKKVATSWEQLTQVEQKQNRPSSSGIPDAFFLGGGGDQSVSFSLFWCPKVILSLPTNMRSLRCCWPL